jgi:bifunctional N-acetylglucosamine-1-phosphate-uridyltransferase/glucosamine-1-phosphate-acetyltransferase GlmU-like protein
MIRISEYIARFYPMFQDLKDEYPWTATIRIASTLIGKIKMLDADYNISGEVAIHKSAFVDSTAIVKDTAIIGANCFVGPHALLRGGVFLDENVSVGPGCEIKSSYLFMHSTVAHFNFVGDSLLGAHVNLEAGAVIANHYNERQIKEITVMADGKTWMTGIEKFGALVGDDTKIGANAVLSPGTILKKSSIVNRLQLVDQSRPLK